jgi:hypothetical protein
MDAAIQTTPERNLKAPIAYIETEFKIWRLL